ncbi:MAG: helix-turn-helix transcriptional regulator [Oscillospiraceae bacterium]|nr:helix-turn-helix transcriptional regulator [Oscillospiraceae bacterium]
MNIAENLKKKREEYDLEQQELAKRAGVSTSLICAIERGLKLPSLGTVVVLADIFHCSVDELIGRKVS